MTPRATTGGGGSGPPAPDGRTDSVLGGTRSLLEAVLRELNQGLHSHQVRATPLARKRLGRQQG